MNEQNSDSVIALTDGTVVRGITSWLTPRSPGPIGSEYIADSAAYGEVKLADESQYYTIIDRGFSDFDDDAHQIASGHATSSDRE